MKVSDPSQRTRIESNRISKYWKQSVHAYIWLSNGNCIVIGRMAINNEWMIDVIGISIIMLMVLLSSYIPCRHWWVSGCTWRGRIGKWKWALWWSRWVSLQTPEIHSYRLLLGNLCVKFDILGGKLWEGWTCRVLEMWRDLECLWMDSGWFWFGMEIKRILGFLDCMFWEFFYYCWNLDFLKFCVCFSSGV